MTATSRAIAGFRFATAQWAERERLAVFREQIGRMIVKLDPEPLDDGKFHVEANVRELSGLGQRLARAHRLLTDPRRIESTIGTIAFESGFGDLSYFNRNYGVTPSEIRTVPRRS